MNLIKIKNQELLQENQYSIKDWRKVDFSKIDEFINECFANVKKLNPEFEYEINKRNSISPYLGDFINYMDEYIISQKYKTFEKTFNFFVPKLIQGNFFYLNNALYVPILMLEKAPIDRVNTDKKNKIYANVNPIYNFTFDFVNKKVFFNFKKISIDLFLRTIFHDDEEYLDFLFEKELIEKKTITLAEKRKFVKFIGFHKDSFFDEIDMAQWIDEFLILSYYHDLFEDYYGIRGIKEITKKIIEYYLTGYEIDMADIKNRRVVHIEYLIKPLFESYLRLLYGAVDKTSQGFLISMNPKVILTTGFGNNLHRGNLYDISIPFPTPLIHKVSQDISIINDGRLPKSWQRNDKSAFGLLCPVSVSAQDMASNLVFTSNTKLNKFGRILPLEE